MGYLSAATTDVLPLPSNPTYTVTMRRKARYGADLAMQDAMIKLNAGDMAALAQQETGNGHSKSASDSDRHSKSALSLSKIEVSASTRALIMSLLVSWTLTDENDQPLPLTAENLDELEPEDGRFLAAEAKQRIKLRTEAERRPFGKPSSLPSAPHRASASRRHGG